MAKGSFSLLRQRRRYLQRNEDWFSINRFKSEHSETLSNPSPKYLEKQELHLQGELDDQQPEEG